MFEKLVLNRSKDFIQLSNYWVNPCLSKGKFVTVFDLINCIFSRFSSKRLELLSSKNNLAKEKGLSMEVDVGCCAKNRDKLLIPHEIWNNIKLIQYTFGTKKYGVVSLLEVD